MRRPRVSNPLLNKDARRLGRLNSARLRLGFLLVVLVFPFSDSLDHPVHIFRSMSSEISAPKTSESRTTLSSKLNAGLRALPRGFEPNVGQFNSFLDWFRCFGRPS
jgi:hypothetical protein